MPRFHDVSVLLVLCAMACSREPATVPAAGRPSASHSQPTAAPATQTSNRSAQIKEAIAARDVRALQSLIASGADADVRLNDGGDTPLILASADGWADGALFLLTRKADPNLPQADGITPLHAAAIADQALVASMLLTNGAKIHVRTKANETPLHIAAQQNAVAVARVLLMFGAEVNTKGSGGRTALHLAAAQGHVRMIEYLLSKAADPRVTDDQGLNPADVALKAKQTDAYRLLTGR